MAGSWIRICLNSVNPRRIAAETFVARVESFDTLGSTNDDALTLAARRDLPLPLLIYAREQTAGRGRGANRWWAQEGSLTFSLLLEPESLGIGRALWPRLSLVTGLAVCEAVEEFVPRHHLALKWPNDVLVLPQRSPERSGKFQARKLGGILVEAPPYRGADAPRSPESPESPNSLARLVIGIGVNVNNSLHAAPPEIQTGGAALCDLAETTLDPEAILIAILRRFAQNAASLAAGTPDLPVRWRNRCALAGRIVEIQAGEQRVAGTCREIDDEGALVLETAAGRRRLFGGSVVSVE